MCWPDSARTTCPGCVHKAALRARAARNVYPLRVTSWSWLFLAAMICAYGVANLLQSVAAARTDLHQRFHPRLLLRLGRHKSYLIGVACQFSGFVLAFLARRDLPLFLVQSAVAAGTRGHHDPRRADPQVEASPFRDHAAGPAVSRHRRAGARGQTRTQPPARPGRGRRPARRPRRHRGGRFLRGPPARGARLGRAGFAGRSGVRRGRRGVPAARVGRLGRGVRQRPAVLPADRALGRRAVAARAGHAARLDDRRGRRDGRRRGRAGRDRRPVVPRRRGAPGAGVAGRVRLRVRPRRR